MIRFKSKFLLSCFIFLPALLFSCGPVENSSALDKTLYGNTFDTTGSSPQFAAVRTSLFKCQNCHGSWLSLKEADFKTLGLVVAKSPAASKLYYRNQNATSGPGPKNMPNGGYPAFSSAELDNLVAWINTL